MKTLLTLSALGAVAYFGLTRFERNMIWPLDPMQASPREIGVAANEHYRTMRDGTEIIVWTKAPHAGQPIIFYLHGNAGNLMARSWRYNWFVGNGYGLVAMSYRGSSGSEGKASERKILSDAQEIWGQISSLTVNHGSPVVIYGESIGGAVGTALATELQDDPRLAGLVLEAPFTSIPEIMRQSLPQFRTLTFALKNRFPTQDRIATITTPLLVMHGTHDQVIPFDMGQSVFAAATSPNKTFIEIPRGGHDNTWQPFVMERLDQFLSDAQVSGSGN